MNTSQHPAFEQHYSVHDLARQWGYSKDTITDWFRDEPGVLVHGREQSIYGKKRAYTTMRIPESVAIRVHEKRARRKK